MAIKKIYGSSRAFTEGHLEVLGDQSEVSNPSPIDPIGPNTKARYASQRAGNAQPWSVRKGNDIHASDPNASFKTRLAEWETKKANQGNNIHGPGPKPVDLGRDRGGNWYKPFNQGGGGRGGKGGAPSGNMPQDRVNQAIWRDGRDGSPLTKKQRLQDERAAGALTKREKADQYSAQQPYARNELKTGIEGTFGTLGNFFNKDD